MVTPPQLIITSSDSGFITSLNLAEVRMEFYLFLLLMIPPSLSQYYDPAVTFTFLVEGENIQYGNQLRMSLFDNPNSKRYTKSNLRISKAKPAI